MLDDFLDGQIAVYLDKDNPDEIREFYRAIKDYIHDCPGPWRITGLLTYLLDKNGGPYHFCETSLMQMNGGSLSYVNNSDMEWVTASEFLAAIKPYQPINDNELAALFE